MAEENTEEHEVHCFFCSFLIDVGSYTQTAISFL